MIYVFTESTAKFLVFSSEATRLEEFVTITNVRAVIFINERTKILVFLFFVDLKIVSKIN